MNIAVFCLFLSFGYQPALNPRIFFCLSSCSILFDSTNPISGCPFPKPDLAHIPYLLGRRRTVGEGESQARIDEENPGEIIKDKEGKEGPLKEGSAENLNLTLATHANNTENGNTNGNQESTSPVKEAQQQNGSSSTAADGKDTAVWIPSLTSSTSSSSTSFPQPQPDSISKPNLLILT